MGQSSRQSERYSTLLLPLYIQPKLKLTKAERDALRARRERAKEEAKAKREAEKEKREQEKR